MQELQVTVLNYWHWFALATLLSIADLVFGANLFLILCGVVAAFVGFLLMLFPVISWEYQFITFALMSVICFLYWRKVLYKGHVKHHNTLNQRSAYYIGRIFVLEEPIVNGRGKIRVDDSIWLVAGDDIPEGTTIKVIGVEGVLLKVRPI